MSRYADPRDACDAKLKELAAIVGARIDACHAVEIGDDDGYTAEARQAIREEKTWLAALMIEINDRITR